MSREVEVLYENNNKKLVLYRDIREDTVKLFDEVLWGTGENQYQHKDSKRRLELLENPNFVELHFKDELAGVCLFINRKVKTGDLLHNYFAVRYLFSVPKMRHLGITGRYAAKTMDLMEKRQETPTLFVGVVEHKNKRSFRLVRSLGYQSFATLKTMGFSRFFPKKSKRVFEVSGEDEKKQVLNALEEFYSGYSLVHLNSIFKEPYFVYKKDGVILAGVQAQKAHWVVKNLGKGLLAAFVKIVPYLPFFRKIFNPNQFEFVGLDGIFYLPGKERELFTLFSHVLRTYKVNSAMFWADEKSHLYEDLTKSGKMGFLSYFTREGDSYMMVKPKNIPPEEIEKIKEKPSYHSAFDFL